MNGFFEPLRPLPVEPEAGYRMPPWLGAPSGALPRVVVPERVLARTETAAVCVTRLDAYQTGFELDLVTMSPAGCDEVDPFLFGLPPRRRSAGQDELPPETLRFGVQYADGRKATNVSGFQPPDPALPPAGPVMTPGGGGGGGGRWHQSLWVWPLPPPGPLLLVCEWPQAGIALTRSEIDARLIIEAAARAQIVFADEPLPERPADVGPPPTPHTG